ncbi:hypothetical protein IRJ41_025968 [Triplophysa rosa]|uniref:Tc1-like transposase DDE domain-containing protein n=1 Tax=Triplophysa rosa TaxID=992332 RepID=A0A9W7TER9_TRIRA|nr:hypothetical protein IRJ41_025968 [Triplophysa rosa]
MREAGQRVHPHLSRFTVASIIRTFRLENKLIRRPSGGGRQRLFTQKQELAIVEIVRANNAICLHQLQQQILADRQVFININRVGITMIRRVLVKHKITMKHIRILDMDGAAQPHEFIYIDEAGFNLSKTRRRGHNMCTLQGLLHHHAKLGPYNTQHILTFLDALHDAVVQGPVSERRFSENSEYINPEMRETLVVRHHNLPPYLPFLNPIEEFFSAWRWRVYGRQPHARMLLLQAMEEACGDIEVRSIHEWIRHTRRYFPCCLAGENIACDVDEILWPDPNRRQDP